MKNDLVFSLSKRETHETYNYFAVFMEDVNQLNIVEKYNNKKHLTYIVARLQHGGQKLKFYQYRGLIGYQTDAK